MTLADLLARFRREGSPPRSRKPAHWWDRWRADTGRTPLVYLGRDAAALQRRDILALRDAVTAERYAPASAGMTILGISAAYAWAIEQELLQHNPCKGVPIPPARKLTEHLEWPDVLRLLALAEVVRPDLLAPIALACLAGLRHGELAALRWEDVHSAAGAPRSLHVCRSWDGETDGPPKNGEDGWVPISERLAQVLLAWRPTCPETALGLVCPARIVACHGSLTDWWGRWAPANTRGIRDLFYELDIPQPERPWHWLRHTCATLAGSHGGTQIQIAALLRHRDPESAARYIHLEGDPSIRAVVDQVGEEPGAPVVQLAPGQVVRLAPEQMDELVERVTANVLAGLRSSS